MSHFFRAEPDGYVFKAFSPIHIITLITLFLGIIAIIYLYKNKKHLLKPISKVLFVALIIEQISLYSWYFLVLGFDPVQSLPLYSCRIAMLSIIFGKMFKSDSLLLFGGYFGFPGGIIALGYPYLDAYSFPHLTNFTFFLGHLLLTWLCTIILMEKKERKEQLKGMLIWVHIFFIITYFVDINYGANYAYLLWSPIMTSTFAKIPHFLYLALIYLVYIVILFLTHIGFGKLRSLKDANKEAFNNIF